MIHDPGILSQWESRIGRMVRHGNSREEIFYALGDANWPHDEATNLVGRIVKKERWKALAMILGFGILILVGAFTIYLDFTAPTPDGRFIYFPVAGIIGFIWGIVRLVKIRA